jgi:hypothetical protein
MSHPRKRHATIMAMESQKKAAAEAEAVEGILTVASSATRVGNKSANASNESATTAVVGSRVSESASLSVQPEAEGNGHQGMDVADDSDDSSGEDDDEEEDVHYFSSSHGASNNGAAAAAAVPAPAASGRKAAQSKASAAAAVLAAATAAAAAVSTSGGGSAGDNGVAAAAAGAHSSGGKSLMPNLQRKHWTKEMVKNAPFITIAFFFVV